MAKKEAKKENNKNKKSFFKDFKAELKKVSWPTPKQLVNNTIAVVTIVIITAAIVFVLDLVFETLNKNGVDKIKEVIGNTVENTTSDTQANETDSESETVTDENSEENSSEENQESNTVETNTDNTSSEENTEAQNNEQ